jgi:transcriptional regulator GlxA family with amidase domain
VGGVTLDLALLPGFVLVDYAQLVEPLRLANEVLPRPLFRWRTVSPDGGPVQALCGTPIDTVAPHQSDARPDYVILFGRWRQPEAVGERLRVWLREAERRGAVLGAVGEAILLLVALGLLNGRRCAAHWRQIALLTELFPHQELADSTTEFDAHRLTCAGGTAAVDAGLALVAHEANRAYRDRCAALLVHGREDTDASQRRYALHYQLASRHPKLGRAVDLMLRHVEEPLSCSALAAAAGTSRRHLERLFRQHADVTVSRFYLRLRLQWARDLLRSTRYSVTEVALASGFVSASHFAKAYKERYGHRPSAERVRSTGERARWPAPGG